MMLIVCCSCSSLAAAREACTDCSRVVSRTQPGIKVLHTTISSCVLPALTEGYPAREEHEVSEVNRYISPNMVRNWERLE